MTFVSNQRPAAPWSFHNFWGLWDDVASLPNVAGSASQLSDVQVGDVAWVTAGTTGLYQCVVSTPGAAVWVLMPIGQGTMHLYQGDLANLTLGVADTPTPSAMRWFGQVNIHRPLTISVVHAHWVSTPAGGGPVQIEVYRARGILTGGPIVWVKLCTVTSTPTGAPQTFVFDGVVPSPAEVQAGDYLFAQAIAKNNSYEGLTLDFHFDQNKPGSP